MRPSTRDQTMPEHIVKAFDTDLEGLRRSISEMGGIAEKMLADASSALVEHDTELAQSVIAADRRLDVLQRDIENRAVLTIAQRQPLAVDLRETVSAFRIAADLERIGDLAKNIGKRVMAVSGGFHPKQIVTGLQHMHDPNAIDALRFVVVLGFAWSAIANPRRRPTE